MKIYLLLFALIFFFYSYLSNSVVYSLKIPDKAIRIRIIPNSNSDFDQSMKLKVKEKLEITIFDLLKNVSTYDEARDIIKNNLNLIDKDIDKVFADNNYDMDYSVNYGFNYFPSKEYKGIKYEEGYYESLLVTLGKGEGDNWWCVLFPPLCLIEGEESSEIEYKSFIKEILEKYLS